jgi:hypothetical protein
MPCAYITDLANSIYKDIGSPSDLSISTVQTKLVSENFIGKLNIAIDECHIIVTGDISPALSSSEQAIYSEMYKYDYYSTSALKTLGAVGALLWTRLREGDSEVSRANPNEVAKFYSTLQKQTEGTLRLMIDDYKKNRTLTQSIDYYTIENNVGYNQGFQGLNYRE